MKPYVLFVRLEKKYRCRDLEIQRKKMSSPEEKIERKARGGVKRLLNRSKVSASGHEVTR